MDSSMVACSQCGTGNLSDASFCASCGFSLQPLPPAAQARAGSGPLPVDYLLKGRFRIVDTLGHGGFGAVYRAEDTMLGNRPVAVKEMNQNGLGAQEIEQAIENFKSEADTLAGLHHTNLPSIHDSFEEAQRWYLVMEFIDGETLERYLEHFAPHRLQTREALDIALQLCAVLEYLHHRQPPIIFRDLKPANIMRTPEGEVYLIDFGIARLFKPGKARDTVAMGSPGYAAPEQFGKAQTDARSDIYSLGVILYQMLSGNDPSENAVAFSFPPLQQQSAEMQALLQRMVAVDPGRRPASADEVRQELQRIASLEGGKKPAAVAAVPAQTRGKGTTICVYSAHTKVVNTLAWSPNGRRIASAGEDNVVRVWEALTGRDQVCYDGHGSCVLCVAWSPSGKRIASAGANGTVDVWNVSNGVRVLSYGEHCSPAVGLTWSPDGKHLASCGVDELVHVWQSSDGKNVFTYEEHEGFVNAVAWSPGGTRIASASDDGTVGVWDSDSGVTKRSHPGYGDWVFTVTWSPHGKQLASAGRDGIVEVWKYQDGKRVCSYREHTGAVNAVAWSPNGGLLASASDDGTVQIWDAATGKEIMTYREHTGAVNAVAWSPDGGYLASGGEDGTVRVWEQP